MSYQKKDSVIGGEFLLFDIDSDKIFTMEDFDSDWPRIRNRFRGCALRRAGNTSK